MTFVVVTPSRVFEPSNVRRCVSCSRVSCVYIKATKQSVRFALTRCATVSVCWIVHGLTVAPPWSPELMTRYLDLSLPSERLQTVARLEKCVPLCNDHRSYR